MNARNEYNHNFVDKWCYCDGPEALPMVQCLRCKDWYHEVGGCIHTDYDFERDDFADGEVRAVGRPAACVRSVRAFFPFLRLLLTTLVSCQPTPTSTHTQDFICEGCLPALDFLSHYPHKSLADRPAWQPHPPQTPATPASASASARASPSPAASAAAAPPAAATPAAPAISPALAAAVTPASARQQTEEEGEQEAAERCAACQRPAVAGAPACLSSLLTCTGRPSLQQEEEEEEEEEEGQEEDDRKPSAMEQEQKQEEGEEQPEGPGACGRRFHPACLPRGAAAARDTQG